MKMNDKIPMVLFIFVPILLVGCTQFESRPLSANEAAVAFESRTLSDAGLQAFMEAGLHRKVTPWPPKVWDFEALTLAALYYHPDLDVARAQREIAEAGEITAAQRPNPTVSFVPTRVTNAASGVSPWIMGWSFTIPIETAGKRGYRIAQTGQLSEAARLKIALAAWQVRSRLRASLLNLSAAMQTEALRTQQLAHHEEYVRLLEHRLNVGAVSRPEFTQWHLLREQIRLALREAERQTTESRVQLANALGMPVAALAFVELSFEALERSPAPETLSPAEIRQQALFNRPDILAALAEYEASQSALQLEIARQYPDVNLGPGYKWDQGDHQWTLGLSMTIPILHQNQGPIAVAEAQRQAASVRFAALQARVVGEVDQTLAGAIAASQKLTTAEDWVKTQEKQRHSAEALFQAGETDRLALISAQLEYTNAAIARLDTLVRAQQALGLLEDAMQRPVDTEMPAPTSFETAPRAEMQILHTGERDQ